MPKSKLYFDNCCFNRPFDDPSQLLVRLETEAVLFIQEEIKIGRIDLVWSSILDFEIKKSRFQSRREAFDVFRRLSCQIVDTNPEIKRLALIFQSRGLASVDALHVACAVYAGCDFFVTVDKRILNKRISELAVLSPISFVQNYA